MFNNELPQVSDIPEAQDVPKSLTLEEALRLVASRDQRTQLRGLTLTRCGFTEAYDTIMRLRRGDDMERQQAAVAIADAQEQVRTKLGKPGLIVTV